MAGRGYEGLLRGEATCKEETKTDGVVKVFDCPTHDMLADPLTKNLPRPSFVRHRQVMLGQDPATSPFIQISG